MNDKSISEKLKPLHGGVVFYPREYVLDNHDFLKSYADGVTEGGKEVRVYIVPEETLIKRAQDTTSGTTIPTIDTFSETHRNAHNPCLADPNNSKETPTGILLIEQASVDETSIAQIGKPTIIGKWASVIQIGDEGKLSEIGKGYLEVTMSPKPTGLMLELMPKFRQLNEQVAQGMRNPLDVIEEKRMLYSRIMGERKKFFVAVIIKHQELMQVTDYNIQNFRNLLAQLITRYTSEGMYGGAMIRVRSGNEVLRRFCYTCNHSYDYRKGDGSLADPFEKVDEFLKYGGRQLLNHCQRNNTCVLEVIPTQRINCARNGNDRYSKDINNSPMGESKILKTYVEKNLREVPDVNIEREKGFVFCNVALRLSLLRKAGSKGNKVLSAIHAFSRPLGNIYTIDHTGKPLYKIV
ncbi:hypothetical protein P7410_17220 [Vibrio parahaemolyticus]|nr:hypothetical protein [Vibrio parahaemolyticus]